MAITSPLRIAALVKQIPKFEDMTLGADGRLRREGLELEMNPYCRRAVSKACDLAGTSGGEVVVFTLGPPSAEDTLREAIAWGLDRGVEIRAVHVTDPAFAGSDTLATARALVAAVERDGPFDLLLFGRNSVDADTGQVGPEVAELLDLPFLTGVKELRLDGPRLEAACEHDDGMTRARASLPAVLSVAERLCEPCKVDPEERAAVDPGRITRRSAVELGAGPWGQAGSPTCVGSVRVLEIARERCSLSGPVDAQVRAAVQMLHVRGALERRGSISVGTVAMTGAGGRPVAVLAEPGRDRETVELLGAAAGFAARIGGATVAVGAVPDAPDGPWLAADVLGGQGADGVMVFVGSTVEEDIAAAAADWAEEHEPWAFLAPSTAWGREVASRIAARLGAGLTGDAVGFDVEDGRLVAWKPAFGGRLVAAITASSPVQMATVRAGVLPALEPRPVHASVERRSIARRGRVEVLTREHDDDLETLALADAVVGVGVGLEPTDYSRLDPLLEVLGAELGATRKVTDRGWLPRARQIGITGRSIAPLLYVAIGLSGKFNHTVGIRGAGTVLAINNDPDAFVHDHADVSIIADWRDAVPLLVETLEGRR